MPTAADRLLVGVLDGRQPWRRFRRRPEKAEPPQHINDGALDPGLGLKRIDQAGHTSALK
jgi:hypothetical protein